MIMHHELANGRWKELTLAEQLANIGSETYRVYNALLSKKEERALSAYNRYNELMDLTFSQGSIDGALSNNPAMWEELCRFRELYCAAFLERNLPELAACNRYLDQFASIR